MLNVRLSALLLTLVVSVASVVAVKETKNPNFCSKSKSANLSPVTENKNGRRRNREKTTPKHQAWKKRVVKGLFQD